MFCKYCGTRLDDVQKFCGVCGRAVDRNIKFADPAAKLLDEAEKSETPKIEAVEEAPEQPVEECAEVEEEAAEAAQEAVPAEEIQFAEPEAEPVKNTGLKIGLLVWTIINMAFGMEVFGIPALILNIRSAKRPENKTKKSISYIKILNFAGSLSLALLVFYGIYMSVQYSILK